jgi:GTPase SAR1 family protein
MDMADTPKLKIALFGQSGAGKTTFFSSYYGSQRSQRFEKEHGYRLRTKIATDGNTLLGRYQAMEQGQFPIATDMATIHEFDLMVRPLSSPGMEISWLDYPGGWWERVPKDQSEKIERRKVLGELISSHAIILLLDAARWQDEGRVYLRDTLHRFSNLIEDIKSDLEKEIGFTSDIPQTVLLAVSKADLLREEETAETVARKVLSDAMHEVNAIARSLGSSKESPAPFLSHIILLSSAACDADGRADVSRTMSLNLIAPIVLAAILDNAAKRSGKKPWSGYLASMLDGLASLLWLIDKIDDFLPKKYQIITAILRALPLETLARGKAEDLRRIRQEALERFDVITAAAAAMASELIEAQGTRAYFRADG